MPSAPVHPQNLQNCDLTENWAIEALEVMSILKKQFTEGKSLEGVSCSLFFISLDDNNDCLWVKKTKEKESCMYQ